MYGKLTRSFHSALGALLICGSFAGAAEFTVTNSENAELTAALPTIFQSEELSVVNTGTNSYGNLGIVLPNSSANRYDLQVSGSGSLMLGNFQTASGIGYGGNISVDGVSFSLKNTSEVKFKQILVNGGTFEVLSTNKNFWAENGFVYGKDGGTIKLTANHNYHLQGALTVSTTAPDDPSATVNSYWTDRINLNGRRMTFSTAEGTVLNLSGLLFNYGTYTKTGAGTLEISSATTVGVYQNSDMSKYSVAGQSVTVSEGTLRFTGKGLISTNARDITDKDGNPLSNSWLQVIPVTNNAEIEFASTAAQSIRNLSGTNSAALIRNSAGAMTLTLYSDTDTTYAGAVRGSSMTLVKDGTGSLKITGTDTSNVWNFANLQVLDGTLDFSPSANRRDGSSLTSIGTIYIDGGTLNFSNNMWQTPVANAIQFGPEGGTFSSPACNVFNSSSTIISTSANAADSIFSAEFNVNVRQTPYAIAENSKLTASGRVWNIGGMTKTGKGTLVLSAKNAMGNRIFTSSNQRVYQEFFIDLQEGTVQVTNNHSFGNASQFDLETVKLNSQTADSSIVLQTAEGTELTYENYFDVDGVGSNIIDVAGASLTISKIGGTGTLTKTGAGTLYLGGIAESEIAAAEARYTASNAYYSGKTYDSPLNASLSGLTVTEGALSLSGETPLTVEEILFSGANYVVDSADDLLIVGDSLTFTDGAAIQLTFAPESSTQKIELFRFANAETASLTDWSAFVTSEFSDLWLFQTSNGSFYAAANSNALPEPASWILLAGAFGLCGVLHFRKSGKRK